MMKISVIIPTYKPGRYIEKCLDTLESSTLPEDEFEVVIVLNGCRAPYLQYLQNMVEGKGYGNVRIVQTDAPGVSNARNIGLGMARGRYVLFIDDDDWVSEGYLSDLLAIAAPDAIANSNFILIGDSDGRELPYFLTAAFRRCKPLRHLSLLVARSFLSTSCGKLIPMELIGDSRFDTSHRLGEDALFMFSVSDRIKHIRLSESTTVYYVRARQNSASRSHHTYKERVGVALRLTRSYVAQYLHHPFSYDFLFFASRVYATVIKLTKKVYE